jgi:hypothetical protein
MMYDGLRKDNSGRVEVEWTLAQESSLGQHADQVFIMVGCNMLRVSMFVIKDDESLKMIVERRQNLVVVHDW